MTTCLWVRTLRSSRARETDAYSSIGHDGTIAEEAAVVRYVCAWGVMVDTGAVCTYAIKRTGSAVRTYLVRRYSLYSVVLLLLSFVYCVYLCSVCTEYHVSNIVQKAIHYTVERRATTRPTTYVLRS